jgi:hypothetical protein
LSVKDDDGTVSLAATKNLTVTKSPVVNPDNGIWGIPGFEIVFALVAMVAAVFAGVFISRRRTN